MRQTVVSGPRRVVVAVCLALFGSGCAVGPDYQRPATTAGDRYTRDPLPEQTVGVDAPGGTSQRWAYGQDISAQWWEAFHCDSLDRLIKEAFEANPSIQAAQAALRQANELAAAQRGFFAPTIAASFTPSRQKNPVGTLAPTLTSGVPVFSLYTTQLSVGYTLDLFGANRRQVESLVAQADMQRFQLEATYITLSTNVVTAAVQEAALRAQIAATERMIAIETEQLQIMQREVELGAISVSDATAQEVLLAQTAALLPPLRKQLALQRDALSALLGRLPSQEPAEVFELSSIELPADLPVSLPSRIVEQRPDVRAAEEQMHAASANVGVAIANMLPQLTFEGTLGGTATSISKMFSAGDKFWTVGASLSQTLFAGGTLYHRERAAVDALDEAGALYRAAVITAFQNVADTLHALVFDAQALKADLEAERSAQRNLEYTRKALDLGSVSYLALLNAEQSYLQAVVNRVQAQANRYSDTAALFQALGGGWWNRPSGQTAER
ncbi:MAG TPA: efflux transporter outer membrane subunit [Burkholderiaceae bacterium]|nr:efflux transporter outer membrane subunit [Burkholderiaceae bacterium]